MITLIEGLSDLSSHGPIFKWKDKSHNMCKEHQCKDVLQTELLHINFFFKSTSCSASYFDDGLT